jgi:hypothetical protein
MPAARVPGFSVQKAISRKLAMPTPVQPISSTAMLPARTSKAIEARKKSRRQKKRRTLAAPSTFSSMYPSE